MRPFLLAVLAVTLITAGCGGSTAGNEDPLPPRIRAIHGLRDAGAVNVLVDGVAVATDLPYGGSSPENRNPALETTVGSHTVTVTRGGTTVLTLPNLVLRTDDVVTLAAIGSLTGTGEDAPRFTGATDRRRDIVANNTDLRIVNGSLRLPEIVDVYLTRSSVDNIENLPPTANGLARYRALGTYRSLDGEYRVRVTTSGTKTVVAEGTVNLRNGLSTLTLLDDEAGPGLRFSVAGE